MKFNKLNNNASIDSLTGLRGLAALWVCLFHFWPDFTALFPILKTANGFMTLGNQGVPLFFLLSGYILHHVYKDLTNIEQIRNYLYLRVARIYPVHIATLLVTLLMYWVANLIQYNLSPSGYTIRSFIENIFLIHAWKRELILTWNFPSWSISIEWLLYILFPALIYLIKRCKRVTVIFIFICSMMALMILSYYGSTVPYAPIAVGISAFFAGTTLRNIHNRPYITIALHKWESVIALFVLIIAINSRYLGSMTIPTIMAFIPIIIHWCTDPNTGISKIASTMPIFYLGQCSYSLYMSQSISMKILYKTLPAIRFSDAHLGKRLLVIITYPLIIGLITLMTYYLIEKPLRQWVKRKFNSERA